MSEVKVAVVIPCYNTSAACVDVIRRVRGAVDALLVVDDGSTDDTPQHIQSTGCLCLRFPSNRGKGVALKAGIEEVLKGRQGLLGDDFDYVLTIDGDGQHDPSEIPRFLSLAARERPDLVLGVRDPAVMPPKSRIGNYCSRFLFFLSTGQHLVDTQCGFRLLSRSLLVALLPAVTWHRYETEAEILVKACTRGYTVATIEIATIYFDKNRQTHFDPLWDSIRVIGVLTRSALASLTGGWTAPAEMGVRRD
jgi:glycosyltransferase involved in cell wall biosynthesis